MKKIQKEQGFTLIELLVVVSIIGLLASITLVSLNTARAKARDASRQANIQQLMTALELYYDSNGEYPLSGGATSPNVGWSNSNDTSWDTLQAELAPYLSSTPLDPINSPSGWANQANTYTINFYSRNYGCARQWYMIVYSLEDTPSVVSPGVQACTRFFKYGGTGTITIGVNGPQ